MQIPQQQLELKDIHLPDSVSWWPPAAGYWIILGLVFIIIIAYLGIKFLRNRGRFKRQALSELYKIKKAFKSDQDEEKLLSSVSVLLRRAAISSYPRTDCASLTGNDWLQWLDLQLPKDKFNFSDGPGYLLTKSVYSKSVNTADIDGLLNLSRLWLQRLPVAGAIKINTARVKPS